MRSTLFRLATTIVAAAGLLALGACSTAVPTETKGVERLGATVLRYAGPEMEAVLGYRFAALNLGSDWLIVDLAATAVAAPFELKREYVFVRTPDGQTVPLAAQREFAEAYPELRSTLQRADLAADPLDYFKARQPCAMGFFAVPGQGLAFDTVSLNDRRVCSGRLLFFVPGGVQAGTWVFGIDLPESKVRIPFRLGARD